MYDAQELRRSDIPEDHWKIHNPEMTVRETAAGLIEALPVGHPAHQCHPCRTQGERRSQGTQRGAGGATWAAGPPSPRTPGEGVVKVRDKR